MDEKINLSSLAGLVADATGFSRRVVETFLKELFTYVSSCLVEGDSVRIPGIGLFKARKVSSRKSVSVTTGKEIEIPAYVKVTFDPDKELAEAVNAPFEIFEAVELADDVTEDMLEEEIVSDNISEATEEEEDSEAVEETSVNESVGLAHAVEESEDEVEEEKEEEVIVADNEPEKAAETAVSEEAGDTEAVSDTIEEPRAVEEEAPADKPEPQPQPDPQPVRRKSHWGWFVSGFACAIFLAFISVVIYWGLNEDKEQSNAKEPAQVAVKQEKPAKDTVSVTKTDTLRQKAEPDVAVSESPAAIADTQPSDVKPEKKYDTVTRTRYLTTMSREYYGNYHFWPYIYEENKAILGHPDRIRPGTKVVIPSLSKYGVDPKNPKDVAEAKRKGVAIYARYRQ